jgi:hypothetical protein
MAGTDNSDQAGRRDAPRGPKPLEDDERSTPPQGGEPERRRDERRTRRQAGSTENQVPAAAAASGSASADSPGPVTVPGHGHRATVSVTDEVHAKETTPVARKWARGRCCRVRFFEARVAEPVIAEEEATRRRPKRQRRNDWLRAMGPGRIAPPLRSCSFTAGTENRVPQEHVTGRTGGRAVLENVPPTLRACLGTFSRGAPSGMAWRRSASQPPSRPSRRPEVAEVVRGSQTPHATAGRRAGTEARRAPNATAGRWNGEPSPTSPRVPDPSKPMIHVPGTFMCPARLFGGRPLDNRGGTIPGPSDG